MILFRYAQKEGAIGNEDGKTILQSDGAVSVGADGFANGNDGVC